MGCREGRGLVEAFVGSLAAHFMGIGGHQIAGGHGIGRRP